MFEFDLVKKEEKDFISLLKPKYLTRDFLDNYKNKKVPFGQLGLIVYLRTYSRYIPELKRREHWWETCLRVVEYSLSLVPERSRTYFSFEDKQKEAEELFDNVFNLNVFPSGRTLFVGGTEAVRLNPSANFNCSFTVVDSIKSFVDAMYLLMLGCGVGYSVEKQYINKLPKFYSTTTKVIHEDYLAVSKKDRLENTVIRIEHNEIPKAPGRTIYITIGDSKNGWVDALNHYLESFTKLHTTIVINYNNVRPEGERLKTFGGRASGHRPLKLMFEEIEDRIKGILNSTIDSVTAMDIMNSIAKAIVVGGVRRSSQIVFGDVDDIKYIEAKKDLWSDPNKAKYQSTRVLSNNSIHLWQKPSWDKLVSIFDTIKNNGEPGLYIAENAAKRRPNYGGSNPSLEPTTKVLTDKGVFAIKDLADKSINVVNRKNQLVKAECFKSGEGVPLIEISLQGSKKIYCTKEHKWFVLNKEGSLNKVETTDLKVGDYLPIVKKDYLYNHSFGTNDDGFLIGYLLGDGWLTETEDRSIIGFIVNKSQPEIKDKLQKIIQTYGSIGNFSDREKGWEITVTNKKLFDFVKNVCKYDKSKLSIPSIIWSESSEEFRKGFIDGIFSSDGHFSTKENKISLTSSKISLLEDIADLLGFYGIRTNLSSTIIKSSKTQFPNGKDYNRTYNHCQLRFSCQSSIRHFYSLFSLTANDKQTALNSIIKNFPLNNKHSKYQEYIRVNDINFNTGINSDVYDISVYDDEHNFCLSQVLTGNCGEILLDSNGVCNLTTTNLVNFVLPNGNWDKDKLFRVTKLSVRMGSRITLVDMWDKEWDYIQKRDRLLGVSLTGIVDAYNLLNDEAKKEFPSLIKQLRDIARQECDKYHDELGIPRSLLVTTNKPEGSISQLPTVSSGIHAPYSPYYFRRVRVSKTDPVSKALLDLGLKAVPENNQGDDINSSVCNTLVFTIPIKTSASIRAIDESAIEQLERYKLFITNYVEHTVSVTITVAEHEWNDVTKWVWDNWEYCIGIAFLPRFDPSELDSPYPNMPYESITKEQYYDIELDEEKFIELISKYELEHEEHELEYDCKTGCPVR